MPRNKSFGKSMVTILLIFGAIWLILNVVYFVLQPAMIFIPSHDMDATPADWGMPYEDVWLDSHGHRIHGWWISGARDNAALQGKTLLYFHGNAGNISHRRESIQEFHELGLDQLVIDYSGYGRSEGHASEHAMYADAQAAWHYTRQVKNVAADNILIFGRSLGGAVALDLADSLTGNEKAGALILESTFTSARDMAKRVVPLISPLIYQRFQFNSLKKIKRYHGPLLIIHSREDEVIPFFMGEKLFAAANQNKHFVAINGDHNSGFLQHIDQHKRELVAFVKAL